MDISDEYLNQLITDEKIITKKPLKAFIETNGCRRNDFLAQSNNGDIFKIFMRQSLLLPEDFSIGLIWKIPEQTDIILCRFNLTREKSSTS